MGVPDLYTKQDAFTDPGAFADLYRNRADAAAFGQGNARGLWFLRVNIYRDLLALTNRYTSAWDTWRNATDGSKVLDPSALAAADSVAAMIGDFEVGAAGLASLTAIAAKHELPPWQS